MAEQVEETTVVEEETSTGPGRKPGAMKRDAKGRLLKKDGSLAKTPGRKKGSTAKAPKATKGKRGRPKGSTNKTTTTAKTTGKRGRPKGSTNKKTTTAKKRGRPAKAKTTQTTTVAKMPKELKTAIKLLEKATAMIKAL